MWRAGQSSAPITAPNSASLAKPLTKLAKATMENSRMKPAIGEIFDKPGFSGSNEKMMRC